MTSARGLIWCCTFLVLDAVQAVYLGGLFQRQDSFLLGGVVFGLSASACLLWTGRRHRGELSNALRSRSALLGLNVSAAGAWLTYLIAIQLIEPAIVFTVFSGFIPMTAVAAGYLGVLRAPRVRNGIEALGYLVLIAGILMLAATTLLGWSGFVRGGISTALAGLGLAALSGALIAAMLLFSDRLDRAGVGPVAQFGLRFPVYVILAMVGFALGIDDKGPVPTADFVYAVVTGLLVLAFPIYAVQKAVSLTSTLNISLFAAAGPFVVFLLQTIEGRVGYAETTLTGLTIYFVGALIVAVGSIRAATRSELSPE